MKKNFKLLFVSFICMSFLIITGCSCSSPMSVKYSVTSSESSGSNKLSMVMVDVITNKKFREPLETPCYRKMKANKKGYVELKLTEEIQECFEGKDCYIKDEDGKYKKITYAVDFTACQDKEKKCYQYIGEGVTYYRLIEDKDTAGTTSSCYDADGNYFEKATHDKTDRVEIEKDHAIHANSKSFDSTSQKIPSNKNYSLEYVVEIKNNNTESIYVKAWDLTTLTSGVIKDKKSNKIKLTLPANKIFMDNVYYYEIKSGEKLNLVIELKYVLTSDAVKKGTKEITLNFPIDLK